MSSNAQPEALPSANGGDNLEAITQELLPNATQYTSFAMRNPSKDIIPLRANGDRSVARTDDDTMLKRLAKQVNTKKLDAAVEAHLEQHRAAMEILAKEHNVPLAVIEQRCNHVTVYKKERKVNLANAITHAKAKEYNKDLPMGERLRLAEILKKIQGEPEKNLSKEEKVALMDDLEQHRRTRKTGARANNKAAGKDAALTIARFQQELINLHERTGMHGFAIFSRGHVDDANCMEACETPGALDFFPARLQHNVQDIVRIFDNYTSSNGVLGPLAQDKRPALRTELSDTIRNGLQIAVNNKRTKMNYASYQTAIVEKQHVEIIGWPEELPLVAPSEMSSAVDLRELVSLWRSGACRWRTMSAEQVHEHRKEVAQQTAAGEIRARKERSDKGSTRKRKNTDTENDAPAAMKPSKRAKQARKPAAAARKGKGKQSAQSKTTAAAKLKRSLPPKSKRFIDSDEEEDEDEDVDYDVNADAVRPSSGASPRHTRDLRTSSLPSAAPNDDDEDNDDEEVDQLEDD